jgi:hypothetical protein
MNEFLMLEVYTHYKCFPLTRSGCSEKSVFRVIASGNENIAYLIIHTIVALHNI